MQNGKPHLPQALQNACTRLNKTQGDGAQGQDAQGRGYLAVAKEHPA